ASSSGNVDKAIENYLTLIERFPADNAGLNNLAVSYFLKRRFDKALEYSDQLLEIFPNRPLYRGNHALYLMYSGQFEAAAQEGQETLELDPSYHVAWLPIAVAAVRNGDYAAAASAYGSMADASADAGDIARLAAADLALYRGLPAAAAAQLREGLARGGTVSEQGDFARRMAAWQAVADVDRGAAFDVEQLLTATGERRQPALLVPAAWALVGADAHEAAESLAQRLAQQPAPESRAYGSVIRGWIALATDTPLAAIDHGREALRLADLWLVRDLLGRAYLAAGSPVEAMSEFDVCAERLGEGIAAFLDDLPTLRLTQELEYWRAQARQGAGLTDEARRGYAAFVAQFAPDAEHPLLRLAQTQLDEAGTDLQQD
ncbi:MAG: tetratricopeptide repeat protein, partial [Pseudomonadota bacterium]